MHRRALGWTVPFFLGTLFVCSSSPAVTLIHNQLVATPNGPAEGLFEVTNGVRTQILTGLRDNTFPSVSRDGRYILISAADPLFPIDPSGDIFEFDRVTGQRRQVIDNEGMTLPNGFTFYSTPLFNALSPNNELIAVASQLGSTVPQSATPRILELYRASDGSLFREVERGPAVPPDLFRPEFVGISWSPDGSVFASPGYVSVITNSGRSTVAAGIVLYGVIDPVAQTIGRVGQVTQPQVFDGPNLSIVAQEHALPVFSPDGQRLAYFSITYPDINLLQPATAELFVVNSNGSNPTSLLKFDPGVYPAGLSWTPNGAELVYSVARQSRVLAGLEFYEPRGLRETAILGFINANGGTPGSIPGAPFGYFPSVVFENVAIPGDFNRDGRVDTNDYHVWRAAFGSAVPFGTGADGNNGGFIDAADYVVWRNAAGLGGAAGTETIPVPEPATLLLLAMATIVTYSTCRQMSRIYRRTDWSCILTLPDRTTVDKTST
jgi:hypothetical protein